MEYTESKEAADENEVAPQSNKSAMQSDKSEHSNNADSQPWPYTAIERQMAAASTRSYESHGYNSQSYGAAARPRDRRRKNDRRKTNRFGLGSFLILLWLVAIGLIVVFTDFGRTLQKVVSTMPQTVEKTITKPTSLSTNSSSSSIQAPSTNAASTNAASSTEKNQISDTSTAAASTDALSIPIADVSLRNRPELLEQLVKVYRSQLASNPQDTATLAALERLQERSLSDIQALIAQGDINDADKSLDIVTRVFPELIDNVRYKYLLARTEYMHHQAKDESIAKSASTTSAATATSRAVASPATSTPPTTTPTTIPASKSSATQKTVSTISNTSAPKADSTASIISSPITVPASTAAAKKTAEAVSSSKPEIRSVSIIPGKMVDDRFVPSDGGNVFMVELSYSNFEKVFVEHAEAKLVALLGVPEDSMVLAEVPVIITADRGTKSFLMETKDVQGYAGGRFQIEFLLNDEFLASRDVRLSRPRH